MRKLCFTVLISLGLAGCVVDRVDPVRVPLAYSVNPEAPKLTGALSCSTVGPIEVTDARTDKVVGVRTLEKKPGPQAQVTVDGDPAAWVRQGVDSYLSHNGFKVQGSGPHLALTIDELHTTESVWQRASYEGHIALSADLKSPGGKSCWKGTVQGKGGNYGYAGSIQNYQETLNRALDDATVQLTSAQAFRDALCHCSD